MKRIPIIILFIITGLLFAQNDFDDWKKKQASQLNSYREKQDTEFANFLETNWEKFKTYKSNRPDDTPKPIKVPETKPKELKQVNDDKKISKIEVNIEKPEKKENVLFAVDKSAPVIEIDYFGLKMDYNYQDKFTMDWDKLDEKVISKFWLKVSSTDYKTLIDQLKIHKEKMEINDWGYCLLINKIGSRVVVGNENLQRMFVWFLLTKSGYDSKIGFNEDNLYLLLPTNQEIYNVSYVMIDNSRYYAISFNSKQKLNIALKTYEKSYPDSDALINLNVDKSPKIGSAIVEKELKFKYGKEMYNIPVKYDTNAIKFFQKYPQTNLDVYFNAPLSPIAINSLTKGFQTILKGRSETEAANILLRFVQTAFEYKTDDEQFGKEKSFFSDEMLFYPYSDCEDRSILYSFLVSKLLNLHVIGLDFPGHISTAVKFNSIVEGDSVIFNESNYTICDPTYINANLGMSIPKYKNLEPEIIELAKKK